MDQAAAIEAASAARIDSAIVEGCARGARALGLQVPATPPAGRAVAASAKYRLLQEVVAQAGEEAVLQLAGAAPLQADNPVLYVLLNVDSPQELVARQRRFARTFHSDHVLRFEEIGAGRLLACHQRRDTGGPTPRLSHLFVCGLQLALLAEIGATGLAVRFPDSDRPEGWLAPGQPVPSGACSRFELRWAGFSPRRSPLPGFDEVLLAQAPAPLAPPLGGTAEAVRARVCAEPGRAWTLARMARELGLSSRTLQRRLAAGGRTFSALLDEVRLDCAAAMLRAEPLEGVAAVAFRCGFADGPHLARRFRATHGCSPSQWRLAR